MLTIVRTAFSLVCLLLCTFFLSQNAQAQIPVPHSYLFVEVADPNGVVLMDANVRLSNANGTEVLNLKTSRDGTANSGFSPGQNPRHYDLQISKNGYLPYETVLFPSVPNERYFVRLTEEFPNTTDPAKSASGPPLKIILREASPDPRASAVEAQKHKLLLAVKRGDAPSVKKLLQEGLSPDSADAKGVPAVAWATFAGDPEILKLLLEAGANVRTKASGALLLYLAEGVFRNPLQAEIIDKLIAAGAGLNASNSYHGTVLNKAILQFPQYLSLQTINALIKAGANVNAADSTGQTPLMLAAQRNLNELFDVLLSAGAKRSLNAKDKQGLSTLSYAASGYHDSTLRIVKVLLANGAAVTDGDLMLAARAAAVETVRLLLKAGASVNTKDAQGQTALMWAVNNYYTTDKYVSETVKLLLAAAAKINEVDANGRSVLMYVARSSSDAELINLLIAGGANVNFIDTDGQTALSLAVQAHSPGTVQTLLKAGAASTINTKDNKGKTPLLYAIDYGGREEIVHALLAAGAFVDEVNEKGETPLIVAVQKSLSTFVKLLLEARASANIADKSGNTPLMYAKSAASGPDAEIFNALIDASPTLNNVNDNGDTLLISAASKQNNLATVRQLLSTSARGSINARNKAGETALLCATAYSDPEVVAALLAAGANVNDADNAGQTVLMRAAGRYESGLEVVKLLLKAGANVNTADTSGRTALMRLPYLQTDAASAVFKELIAAKANVNAVDAAQQTVLMSVVQRRFPLLVQLAVEAGAAVNAKDRNGRTALVYALSDNLVEPQIVKALIAGGANINEAGYNGVTPLMLAAHQQSLEAVKMLLAAGAAVDVRDKDGQSALMRAAIGSDNKDSTEVVKTLLAAKANVDDVDQSGRTALMFASHTSYVNPVKVLLAAGASVKTKDKNGLTALIHAADEAHVPTTEIVRTLIAAGANVNEADARRQTPLMLASLRGFRATVTTLIEAGADVNARDEGKLTPLMFAAWHSGTGQSAPEIVRALLKAGAKVNDAGKDGKSAVMFAAQYGAADVVRLVLAARASINARNDRGESALFYAISGSRDDLKVEVVTLLLRSGADVNIKNREGQTAIMLARKLGQATIVKLLEESR